MQPSTTNPAAADHTGSRAKRLVRPTAAPRTNQFFHWLVFFLLAALLALGPVVRGGNRQVALVALLALGLMLLACLGAATTFNRLPGAGMQQVSGSDSGNDSSRGSLRLFLVALVGTCPLWLGLLQLTPLPSLLWASLPGRDVYGPALSSAGTAMPSALPLSLHPTATWTALLSAIPTAAAFFAALYLPARLIDKALGLLLVVGACEMLLALLQFSQGSQSLFYFGMPGASGFVGSFANRNHLADFLAMLIPLWFYRLGQDLQPTSLDPATSAHRAQRPAERHFSRWSAGRRPLWLFFGFALLVVILSTLSRGGVLASALVLLGSSLLWILSLRKRLGRGQILGLSAVVVLFGVLALATVGLEGLGQRLDNNRLSLDAQARNTYTQATLEGARTFWPWGSGVGTFESVFPRFQAAQSPGYVEYAHNDYAQIAMEMGLAGVLLALAVAALVLLQLRSLWTRYRQEGRRLSHALAQRCYCGLGASALLVHSVVEFNMHIPALATTAAFLMGVYLRPLPSGPLARTG